VGDDEEVILITGFGYDPDRSIVRAHRDGLSAVLFKPFKAVLRTPNAPADRRKRCARFVTV